VQVHKPLRSECWDDQLTEELEQFWAWLNLEERRQFDIKYAEPEAAMIDAAK